MAGLHRARKGPSVHHFLIVLSFATLLVLGNPLCGREPKTTFEKVFGVPGILDADRVSRVKSLPTGERLYVDTDGDGKNDEVWYIDAEPRHTDMCRPLLMRVIDEDGDLDISGPDLDSDLYLADWNADGTVDHVVDYQDDDGDGDVDEMTISYGQYQFDTWPDRNKITTWLALDIGDDNQLIYPIDGTYRQEMVQYRSHFSGNEVVYNFNLDNHTDRWTNIWENPFAFYDPDADDCSEVVVRITSSGDDIKTLRYSMDADDDAQGAHTHDYDFSITALPNEVGMKMPKEVTGALKIRGIDTCPVLRWEAAETFARNAPWGKALLTWDELNANVEHRVDRDPQERWEGILNNPSKSGSFPQVGGPPCSPLNKRIEVSQKPALPLRLYYDPADHRLHLLGADEGYIDVDFDLDDKADSHYVYFDDDKDGVFDRRTIDVDGDGTVDFDWKLAGNHREFQLEFETLSSFYKAELSQVLKESRQFIDAAKAALASRLAEPDGVETFFLETLPDWHSETQLGYRIRTTPAGARYYMDLLSDRLLYKLKQIHGRNDCWPRIEEVYAAGKYSQAAEWVRKELTPELKDVSTVHFRDYTYRIGIVADNSGSAQRNNWPIVLNVADIKERAVDFNAENCAVVTPDRWIDWFEIPHQVDDFNITGEKEFSFLIDMPADAKRTFYLYYSPNGKRRKDFAPRTRTQNNFDPGHLNIGWESAAAGYRTYQGKLDFFGKQKDKQVSYPANDPTDHLRTHYDWWIYPLEVVNYHKEQPWGMDALHVGESSGLGGLTLYQADRAFGVQIPQGSKTLKITKRELGSGPVRAAVEITAENVCGTDPDIILRMICLIYAEHAETEIDVISNRDMTGFQIAPGLTKLKQEQYFFNRHKGCLGNWGWQDDGIGDIAMAISVPPDMIEKMIDLEVERRLVCDFSENHFRYRVIGNWRRGRQYPVGPTISNWRREVERLANQLNNEIKVEIKESQPL